MTRPDETTKQQIIDLLVEEMLGDEGAIIMLVDIILDFADGDEDLIKLAQDELGA